MPTSEFGHLSGIFKPPEHPTSFTTGTFVTGTTLCIHSSHRFAELRGSTRNSIEYLNTCGKQHINKHVFTSKEQKGTIAMVTQYSFR